MGQDGPMTAVEAWLLGGPADGRIAAVELTADAQIPRLIRLPQTGLYVGASDQPAPVVEHIYVRSDDIDEQVVYQYVEP